VTGYSAVASTILHVSHVIYSPNLPSTIHTKVVYGFKGLMIGWLLLALGSYPIYLLMFDRSPFFYQGVWHYTSYHQNTGERCGQTRSYCYWPISETNVKSVIGRHSPTVPGLKADHLTLGGSSVLVIHSPLPSPGYLATEPQQWHHHPFTHQKSLGVPSQTNGVNTTATISIQ